MYVSPGSHQMQKPFSCLFTLSKKTDFHCKSFALLEFGPPKDKGSKMQKPFPLKKEILSLLEFCFVRVQSNQKIKGVWMQKTISLKCTFQGHSCDCTDPRQWELGGNIFTFLGSDLPEQEVVAWWNKLQKLEDALWETRETGENF